VLIGMVGLAAPAQAASSATCQGERATIVGHGNVRGTNHRDVIVLTGPSVVRAYAGNDLICGSAGRDVIYAGAGNDRVYAGAGADTVFGEAGNDAINGDSGNDIISGGNGNDVVNGGTGNDAISGNSGDDTENGGAGNDAISGQAGSDHLSGGVGNDALNGGPGVDVIDGNDGADVVDGGPDSDVIHLDPSDALSGLNDISDIEGDDSEHAVVDPALETALTTAAKYLSDGIAAGDITGSGNQSTLPPAPSLPDPTPTFDPASLVSNVTWNVDTKDGQPDIHGCVDGTVNGTDFFKLRLEHRDGHPEEGAGLANNDHPVTTGKCDSNLVPVTAPADVTTSLTEGAAFLSAGILDGNVVGEGDQATLPADGANTVPASADLLTSVRWNVDGHEGIEARFCIAASNDAGVTTFHYRGKIEDGASQGVIVDGPCAAPSAPPMHD